MKKIDFKSITNNMVNHKVVFGSILNVEDEKGQLKQLHSSGNLDKDGYYFIASVTKLYVTAMIIILMNQKKLSLDDSIINFFDQDLISGLHVLKGVDYTSQITVRHLLSNQSGLRDYFYYEDSGSKAVSDLMNQDIAWTFDKVIQRVKTLKPLFKPGQDKKVNYSDTNFRMLGEIIEKVTHQSISDAFDTYLFKPLKLKHTFMFYETCDLKIAPIFYKKTQIHAPKYLSSVGAEGGIVSKASDVMSFLKAFFNGFYFPKEQLSIIKSNYRMILFPGQFYFGTGIEKLWIPKILSFKKPIKNLIGFWGQTGSFAFYDEDSKLYFTGTINQASGFGHGKALRGIVSIIKQYQEKGAFDV